jgi:hypothetical protein
VREGSAHVVEQCQGADVSTSKKAEPKRHGLVNQSLTLLLTSQLSLRLIVNTHPLFLKNR